MYLIKTIKGDITKVRMHEKLETSLRTLALQRIIYIIV